MQRTMSRWLQTCGCPPRLAHYEPDGTIPAWTNCLGRALGLVRAGGLVVLCGQRGTGKSMLAAEVCASMIRDGVRPLPVYRTMHGIVVALKRTFRADSDVSEHDVLDGLQRASLLVVDEFQERHRTEWEDRLLTGVVNDRYMAEMPTLIVTNLRGDALAEHLGPSIISRAKETGGVLTASWGSFR